MVLILRVQVQRLLIKSACQFVNSEVQFLDPVLSFSRLTFRQEPSQSALWRPCSLRLLSAPALQCLSERAIREKPRDCDSLQGEPHCSRPRAQCSPPVLAHPMRPLPLYCSASVYFLELQRSRSYRLEPCRRHLDASLPHTVVPPGQAASPPCTTGSHP